MVKIGQETILGVDKNIHVEPGIWTNKTAGNHYQDPVIRSN